jgi:hypothetical protein
MFDESPMSFYDQVGSEVDWIVQHIRRGMHTMRTPKINSSVVDS